MQSSNADSEIQAQSRSVLPEVIELTRQAGKIIMEIYETDFHIQNKKDNTPVTNADLAANHLIVDTLSRLTPDIPVLSEESEEIPFAERSTWETYWLVDPLDGTRAFIEKSGEFSVNIALVHHHHPILGVIYSPVRKCGFYACKGNGAFHLNDADESRAIHVCAHIPRDRSRKIIVAGTRSSHSPALQAFLDNLRTRLGDYEMKYMGSSLKSCMIAEGSADIYARLGPTSEWDTAAAQCVVEEAGGLLTDTQMRPLRYNTRDSVLNPNFFVFGDRSVPWNEFLS